MFVRIFVHCWRHAAPQGMLQCEHIAVPAETCKSATNISCHVCSRSSFRLPVKLLLLLFRCPLALLSQKRDLSVEERTGNRVLHRRSSEMSGEIGFCFISGGLPPDMEVAPRYNATYLTPTCMRVHMLSTIKTKLFLLLAHRWPRTTTGDASYLFQQRTDTWWWSICTCLLYTPGRG